MHQWYKYIKDFQKLKGDSYLPNPFLNNLQATQTQVSDVDLKCLYFFLPHSQVFLNRLCFKRKTIKLEVKRYCGSFHAPLQLITTLSMLD